MKKFAYYKNLNERQRRLYDRSDAVTSVRIPRDDLGGTALDMAAALSADDRVALERASQKLVSALTEALQVSAVKVRVLAVRPSNHREELHGQYVFGARRTLPVITVWMRTAQRKQVVAFRTFYRTLLHEVAHHLDYHLYHFEDSLHTQGFYNRAESLFLQLLPPALQDAKRARTAAKAEAVAPRPAPRAPRPPRASTPARPRRPRAAAQASLPFNS